MQNELIKVVRRTVERVRLHENDLNTLKDTLLTMSKQFNARSDDFTYINEYDGQGVLVLNEDLFDTEMGLISNRLEDAERCSYVLGDVLGVLNELRAVLDMIDVRHIIARPVIGVETAKRHN